MDKQQYRGDEKAHLCGAAVSVAAPLAVRQIVYGQAVTDLFERFGGIKSIGSVIEFFETQ